MENKVIKGRDFIFFGLQPWDIPIGSNCKNIAAEVAKHNRVLYVNRPLDRISAITNKHNSQTRSRLQSLKHGQDTLLNVYENLWVFNPRIMLESINFLPAGFVYNWLNKRNGKKLANAIAAQAAGLGFNDPILFIDDDFFNGLYLKEYLQPSFVLYYIRDFLLSQSYFAKHGEQSEPALMRKADAVAANSKYLADYAKKYNSHVADVGQGCDVEDFLPADQAIPADMSALKKPVIGYCGSLTATRLDIQLIKDIALARPGWTIALVGPEDETFQKSALHQVPNVFFTGGKKAEELPAYVHAFDVCINPQLLNQMTIGNYPRKVDEYLAAGKPVVATKTAAMEMFEDVAYVGNGAAEYIEHIETALLSAHEEPLRQKRIAVGRSHTWEASVAKIYALINNTINNGK